MELRTCEYCGTEYDAEQQQCPLCGRPAANAAGQQPPERKRGKGGARVAPRGTKKEKRAKAQKEDRIPRWMWALICVILGLAVLTGALYFVYIMGYFGHTSTNEAFQPVQTEPADTQPDADSDTTPEDQDTDVDTEDTTPVSAGVPCTGLTLSQSEVTLEELGQRIFLTAVAQPLDCTEEIVFASSDEAVVTIDSNGMITAAGAGEAEITATCGSVQVTCRILCEFEPQTPDPDPEPEPDPEPDPAQAGPAADGSDAYVKPDDFTLFYPGEEATLAIHDAPAGASITYVSSNSAVATVSSTGVVTAVSSGTATITITVNSTTLTSIARCNLGTTTENNGGTSTAEGPCTISHSDVTLFSSGESFTISLTDANGETVSGVSWSTSNGGVCAVDASGKVMAVGSGTATISATYGGQTYSCIVRCNFG